MCVPAGRPAVLCTAASWSKHAPSLRPAVARSSPSESPAGPVSGRGVDRRGQIPDPELRPRTRSHQSDLRQLARNVQAGRAGGLRHDEAGAAVGFIRSSRKLV